jgi:hypothetical protein
VRKTCPAAHSDDHHVETNPQYGFFHFFAASSIGILRSTFRFLQASFKDREATRAAAQNPGKTPLISLPPIVGKSTKGPYTY